MKTIYRYIAGIVCVLFISISSITGQSVKLPSSVFFLTEIHGVRSDSVVPVEFYVQPSHQFDSLYTHMTWDTTKLEYSGTWLYNNMLIGVKSNPASMFVTIDSAYIDSDWNSTIQRTPGSWKLRTYKDSSVTMDIETPHKTICVLLFKVKDSVPLGDTIKVSVADGMIDSGQYLWYHRSGRILYTHPTPGDVNGDSRLTAYDAALILRYLSGRDYFMAKERLDYNRDGQITEQDALYVLSYTIGLR